jgi:SH3-like domain-containing protein
MTLQRLAQSLAAALLFCARTALAAEMVAIAGEEINMRSGPGTEHEVLWKIGAGFPLEVITSKGEWLQVRDFEGSTGWVHKKTTQKTPHMIVKANKGSDQQINVRSEPNTKAPVVAKANYGVVFRTLERQGTWVKVEHGQGVTGWVEGSLLWGF